MNEKVKAVSIAFRLLSHFRLPVQEPSEGRCGGVPVSIAFRLLSHFRQAIEGVEIDSPNDGHVSIAFRLLSHFRLTVTSLKPRPTRTGLNCLSAFISLSTWPSSRRHGCRSGRRGLNCLSAFISLSTGFNYGIKEYHEDVSIAFRLLSHFRRHFRAGVLVKEVVMSQLPFGFYLTFDRA